MANDNMKFTKDLIEAQQVVLSSVIQFLDSNGHSNETIRELVDKVLNHMSYTKKLSKEEIDEVER